MWLLCDTSNNLPSEKGVLVHFYWLSGSCHGNRVFRLSDLDGKMVTDTEALFLNSYHIVGDSAFDDATTRIYVFPAYKDSFADTARKTKFTIKLTITRMVIEDAFGLLKAK